MWESANTTANTAGFTSQLSFYEYPPHKPFVNSNYQPLRPSHALSRKVALPESNRDQLLTALQSLSLRIKTLENEREVSKCQKIIIQAILYLIFRKLKQIYVK
jgi:hypothetical protein